MTQTPEQFTEAMQARGATVIRSAEFKNRTTVLTVEAGSPRRLSTALFGSDGQFVTGACDGLPENGQGLRVTRDLQTFIDALGLPDYSAISFMFARWCVKQGAEIEIEYEDDLKYVHAFAGSHAERIPYRSITAAFDETTGRFARDGAVATDCEMGSASTLKELANALRTGHRSGGHRTGA